MLKHIEAELKKTAIWQMTISNLIFLYENVCMLFKILLKFVLQGGFHKKSALFHICIYIDI